MTAACSNPLCRRPLSAAERAAGYGGRCEDCWVGVPSGPYFRLSGRCEIGGDRPYPVDRRRKGPTKGVS